MGLIIEWFSGKRNSYFKNSSGVFLNYLFLIVMLLVAMPLRAQLQDFELVVTPTDETCSGNGTLTFAVNNATPGAAISYTVYKYPDTVNPISISSSNTLGSLSEGTYKVVAIQALGQETNSEEQDVEIVKVVSPFDFVVSGANQTCVDGAKLIVTVTEGTASLYEIISGPVIRPPQESNVFEGMVAGTYVIRVFNECGDAEVTTYTLSDSFTPPAISDPVYESKTAGDCDTVIVTNTISFGAGIAISYPVVVEYTLVPNNGGPAIVVTQTVEEGEALELSVTETFPANDAGYTYSLKITDGCGGEFTRSGMTLDSEISVSYIDNPILPCGQHYLTISSMNFVPPYTLNFNVVPDGFNPGDFNAEFPGPFTTSPVIFGSDDLPVANGTYQVEIIDSCGNSAIVDFLIEDEEVEPVTGGSNNGCYSVLGRLTVSVPDRKIVSAFIEEAPVEYSNTVTLPNNVTANITTNGIVVLTNMPVGTYKLRIVDECGVEYVVEGDVPPFEPQEFMASAMSGCVVGSGAVRISSGNGKLTSLMITDAPVEFEEELPFDASAFIDSAGVLFMEGLPPGNYTFSGVDICGIEGGGSVNVVENSPPGGAVVYTRKCGNFDLTLSDSGSGAFTDPASYWLQKLINPADNTWGHPVTNVVYQEGTEPIADNSMSLTNGQTLIGLEYEGTFRVVRYFKSYISAENIRACFGDMATFEYSDGVNVKSVYNLSCYQNGNDIYVDATGLAPLQYTITKKDGVPFVFDNGNNSIFSDLEPGTYEFTVEDDCGYIGRIEVNITLLPELTNAHDPGDMVLCVDPGTVLTAEFDLQTQTPGILENQPASVYTVTYYLTAQDAEDGVNQIPTLHTNASNPQTIYARLVHNHIPLCHNVVSFDLRLSEYPELNMKRDYILCEDDSGITISADAGFSSYEWSTGETTPSIRVSKSGNYWVKVGNNYDGIICSTEADITVLLSGVPEHLNVAIEDWTDNNNRIIVNAAGSGDYEYSLDGDSYQGSPVFSNLKTGLYTVYIRDKNGCGIVSQELALLNYPKFFTPNGDGINEKWYLEYSWFEPEAVIHIFDRYGKLIYSFTPKDSGWDGTFNGKSLPSTDYWFVVKRKDGRIHKGHFSMIR